MLGDNTDGAGLVRDLRDNLGLTLTQQRVLICGAGGATRGVLAPLLALEPREIVIANRTVSRAQELAGQFGDLGSVRGCAYDELRLRPFDLIINATSTGLRGTLPPLPRELVNAATFCYDMSYGSGATPFELWAQSLGATNTVQGWGMLVEQAAESFQLWRGMRPDTIPVLAILAERNSVSADEQ